MLRLLEGFPDQLLREVRIVLYDRSDARVAYLSIEVDWEKHRLILSRGSALESLALDTSQSVASQVAPLQDRVICYISAVSQRIGVARTHWQPCAKKAAYDKQFGGSFSAQELEDFRAAREGRELKATDENWPEVTVVFRHIDT